MRKKTFVLCIVFLLLMVGTGTLFAGKKEEPAAPAEKAEKPAEKPAPAKKPVKNPGTIIYARYGTVQSLDPHRAYDTSSGEAVMNMYDTLVAFDGSATDSFVPVIAEKVPSVENGLIKDGGKTYIFPIKSGITFHNGDELVPEDVEYTFERALVTDQDGGPVWMFFEPLLGVAGSRDGDGNITIDIDDIMNAVEVDGRNVIFHLSDPYPPFITILAQYWSGIMNKDWMVANGAWDGKSDGWEKYNNPDQGTETLYNVVMGTGPYKLVKWEPGVEISMTRFDGYFDRPVGVRNVVIKIVEEWTTRKLMFTAGDADIVQVDTMYWPEMERVEGATIYKDLPRIENTAVFFNFDINMEANQAVWSGKLDGEGIPSDFFNDPNVRKGFAHAFDHDTYVKDAFLGYAETPNSPVPKGLPYRDDSLPIYEYDMRKAEEHLKKAWGGQVWEKGFKLSILYNTGNDQREIACQMIEENVESLNPKFQIEIQNVDWGNYLNMMVQKKCGLFVIGWVMDYPDPHNFVHPYMHSRGTFAEWQNYSNPEVDALVTKGIKTVDPGMRKDIYYEIEKTYYTDIPGFMLSQSLYRVHVRDWISGYFWNPARDQMMLFSIFDKED